MARGQSKSKPRRLVLQPRDYDVLTGLGTAGTLDTNVIWRHYFPADKTGQSCRRRLGLLNEHGLVQRTFIEVTSATGNGRAPITYNLTPKGGQQIEDHCGICHLRTSQGDRLSPKTLRHRAGIGELVLTVSSGCRNAGLQNPEWILEYDTEEDVSKDAKFSRRFKLCQEFKGRQGGRIVCWPDVTCQVALSSEADMARLVMVIEYDRSTEDHPQLRAKLPAYELLFAEQTYLKWWPAAQDAYLFFVFQSETRVRNAAKSFATEKLAPKIRMAVASELANKSPITDPVWFTTSLERRALLGQSEQ